ncbi:MAG: SMI1/KNR4 family protein [Kiloniellales bacterium]|nr:SMI1/KNR4 family protein [Kiloniellales bacterium]
MAANPETIWQVPAYLPYLQPPLTETAVAAAEREIGHRLPEAYLDLLRKQNGGYIRFSLPEYAHEMIAGIGPHFPSLTDFDWTEVQDHVSFPLGGLVPFDGDGHWHLCLDYRDDGTGAAVTYVDIECDEQARLAPSFADYLALLRIEADDDVLETTLEVEEIVARLSAALGVDFDPPDSWAHGYPQRSAALGNKGSPEWLWLSPNLVPRGFVRPEDDRYEALKDLLPGEALRYPEAPEGSFLLATTAGARTRVREACRAAKLAVRPLRDYLQGG